MDNYLYKMKNNIKYLAKQRQFDKALEEAEKYLELNPSDDYMVAYKANIYYKLGDSEKASEIATSVVESVYVDNSVKSFAYEILAKIATANGDREQAIVLWEHCVELSALKVPTKALSNLSRLYNQIGQRTKALEILEIKDDSFPTPLLTEKNYNPMAFNVARAYIYYGEGDYEQVIKELNRPVSKVQVKEKDNRAYADRYFLEGLVNQRQNKYEEAIKLYKKALTFVDNKRSAYWDTLYQLAGVYYQLGNDELALSLCDEIIKTCEKPSILLGAKLIYANNYVRRCNLEAAKEAYDKCLDEVEKKIGYAKLEVSKYNFEDAIKILNSIDTNDDSALYNMNMLYSEIMFRYNKYDKFIEYYDKVLSSKQIDRHLDSLVDIKRMRLALEVKNNLPITEKDIRYADKQIINYDTTRAINHIFDRHVGPLTSGGNFSRNSNIGQLYYHIIDNLDKFNDQKFCEGLYDKYIVNLQETGYVEENVRFVTVVCIADTHNIITMYPSNRYTGVFTNEVKDKPVQKRLTAIEKFNKKYGK